MNHVTRNRTRDFTWTIIIRNWNVSSSNSVETFAFSILLFVIALIVVSVQGEPVTENISLFITNDTTDWISR